MLVGIEELVDRAECRLGLLNLAQVVRLQDDPLMKLVLPQL